MSISLIRDRVKVTILRDTSAIERVSFGVPLFIGETDIGNVAASYANIEEVAAAYAVSDPEYLAAQAFFTQTPQPREIVIGFKDAVDTYPEALAAIRAVNDTWFAVAIESRVAADALLMAPAVSALPGVRQFWAASDDLSTIDPVATTDLASQFKAANYDQARVVYDPLAATTYPEMAMMGRVLPIPESRTSGPGTAAWHDQPVVGVVGINATSTQRSALEDKNAEYFISVAGATRAMGGKMAGGEWGDVMHGIAWLETRLAEDIYQHMTRAADRRSKVPFTDAGIASIEGVVRNRLDIGASTGLLTEDYIVTVPRREDTQFGDRATRTLKDVTFDAPLAGAIKFTEINGVVTA